MSVSTSEGSFFLLPIGHAQYGVGLVTRAPRRGGILFGYFFGPKRSTPPSTEWLLSRQSMHAIFCARFRDRALYSGEWPTIHVSKPFDRAAWPLPAFHRFDGSVTAIPGASAIVDWRVEYEDNNLVTPIAEKPASPKDLQLGEDSVYDPISLVQAVMRVIPAAVPTADDGVWR